MDYHEIEVANLKQKLEQLVTQWIKDHEERPVDLPEPDHRILIKVRTPWNANNLHLEVWAEVRGVDLTEVEDDHRYKGALLESPNSALQIGCIASRPIDHFVWNHSLCRKRERWSSLS